MCSFTNCKTMILMYILPQVRTTLIKVWIAEIDFKLTMSTVSSFTPSISVTVLYYTVQICMLLCIDTMPDRNELWTLPRLGQRVERHGTPVIKTLVIVACSLVVPIVPASIAFLT